MSDVHSQNGEDGVIREILFRLGRLDSRESHGWCVEFGAWDGVHLSNTFNLIENHGFHAVYIEGDEERFQQLVATASTCTRILPLNEFVDRLERNGCKRLDDLLRSTPIPLDFDVLSIDIDSNDLDIWESVETYSPKVVVIEINSSIWPGIFWRHGYLPAANEFLNGNSFSSTLHVGRAKGYELVCHTGNCIFVRRDLLPRIGLEQRFISDPALLFRPDWLRPDSLSDGLTRLAPRAARTEALRWAKTLGIGLGLRSVFRRRPLE